MRLNQLIDRSDLKLLSGPEDITITGLADDSRTVKTGNIFIARTGSAADGTRFINEATQRGATAVLAERPVTVPPNIALILAPDLPTAAANLANRFHGNPAARLKLLAVTGTNGKTTVAYMVRHLLNSAQQRTGLIGTIEIDNGSTATPASLTTPGRIELTAHLAAMAANNCTACVMEVSSHALHQGRVADLNFTAAAFTNLTGDHLDYHLTTDAYAAAKATLFTNLSPSATAVLNADDPHHTRMAADSPANKLTFAIKDAQADIRAEIIEATPTSTRCRWFGPWSPSAEPLEAALPLVGRHNVANMLAALGLAHANQSLPDDPQRIANLIATCPPTPGRLEPVHPTTGSIPFAVLVDYAHTDDALANVLNALRPVTTGKLRVLFGCGGDRDASKRPRMAHTARNLADHITITSDNPRTESPTAIIEHILTGIPETDRHNVTIEPDRAAAIEQIIRSAQPNDTILLAGKGHEDYQIVSTTKHPFDDRVKARAVLDSLAQ